MITADNIIVKSNGTEEMSDRTRSEMEMYRRLGAIRTFAIEGFSDEEAELKWLNAITWENDDSVYVSEPAHEQ